MVKGSQEPGLQEDLPYQGEAMMKKTQNGVRAWYEDEKNLADMPDVGRLKIWETEAARAFPEGARVLDVGCGMGREAFALHDLGFSVTGVDISGRVIAGAARRAMELNVAIPFFHYDGTRFPVADGSFDVVILWAQTFGLLYGEAAKERFFAECMRVLVPNGLLSFSGHDRAYLERHYPDCLDAGRFFPFVDKRIWWETFEPNELARRTENAGFAVIASGRGAIYAPEDGVVLTCLCRKMD